MNPQSARTLAWAAALMIPAALAVLSPSGTFVLLGVAALSAAIPSALAVGRVRLVSLGLLLLSVGLCVRSYPAFRRHMSDYRSSVRRGA